MKFKSIKKNTRNVELIIRIERLHEDSLGLSHSEIIYLEDRWLRLFLWMDKAALVHKNIYYIVRLTIAIGAIIIPVLVSINNPYFYLLTLLIGTIVPVCIAIEELFKFKDYWHYFRTNAELLRSEGWQFLQQVDRCQRMSSNCQEIQEIFNDFSERVEFIAQSSVVLFSNKIIQKNDNYNQFEEMINNLENKRLMTLDKLKDITNSKKSNIEEREYDLLRKEQNNM
jgi:hypothetical protein